MRVRMLIGISGTRNGVDWPPVGGEIELPDVEAEHMVAVGQAVPVEQPVERAVSDAAVETAAVKPATKKKAAAKKSAAKKV